MDHDQIVESLRQHMSHHFDKVDKRFDRVESKLDKYQERLSRAEEAIEWMKGHIKISITVGLGVITTLATILFGS